MGQVEVSRTLVFADPRRVRAFFEALVADNMNLGRPDTVEIIFGRRSHPQDVPGDVQDPGDHPRHHVTVNPSSGIPGSSTT